jgi:histidine phosphotransfer protein HptB
MSTHEVFDRAVLLERVEGDEKLLAEMIQLYVEDAPRALEAMRSALHDHDLQALERAAHSLKGSSSSLSAKAVAEAASRLEQSAKRGDTKGAQSTLADIERALNELLPELAPQASRVTK